MYEKLPFDKRETIVNHEVALLRRINDVKEKALIQKFIGEQRNKLNLSTGFPMR
jgi:hypothetical protein